MKLNPAALQKRSESESTPSLALAPVHNSRRPENPLFPCGVLISHGLPLIVASIGRALCENFRKSSPQIPHVRLPFPFQIRRLPPFWHPLLNSGERDPSFRSKPISTFFSYIPKHLHK